MRRWIPTGRGDGEQGYTLIMVAASLFLIAGVAAFVVDLSALRLDRAADQRVADLAASAGALGVFSGGAVQGCEDALAYVSLNTPGITTLDDTDCATVFADTCDDTTLARTLTLNSGRFDVTVVNPVPDDNDLMDPGALGATSQTPVAEDGAQCDRVGVEISADHEAFISQVLGYEQGTTTVHAVARSFLPPPDGPPINLLLLDRFGCGVMKASGQGGIVVDAIYDPDTGTLVPGEGAVDSDASIAGGCPSDTGTIDVDGSNALIRADGPTGCPTQTATSTHLASGLTKGHGCGVLRTFAPGTPGCNWPACTGSGANNPNPPPIAAPERITRAPIDHRYNCRPDYAAPLPASISWAADPLTAANEQNIPGCTGGTAEIDQLIETVRESGSPDGTVVGFWNRWSASYPCDIPSSHAPIPLSGNWWIDCASWNVRVAVTIDGNVVADGDISVTSGTGNLTIDNAGSPGFLALRQGVFLKDGQASISLLETTVYASKNSRVQMDGGGSGSLTWIAPDDPDHPLDDLALWSDSTITLATHFWAGQAALTMEGVFFVPIVTVEYAGQGSQIQTKAQFISDKLHARGQGLLVVAPEVDRAVGLRPPPQSILLR